MKVLTPHSTTLEPNDADWDLRFLFASSQVQIKVRQVMTPEVLAVGLGETMAETAGRMAGRSVSCAVVVADGRAVGILTHKDFLYGLAACGQALYEHPVEEHMSAPVHTVHSDCSVLEACRFMDHERIRRLPVVDDECLVGIVTQTDLTRALTSYGAFRNVSEIMSPAVVTAKADATLDTALAQMAAHRISCLVVMSGSHTVGILTERDILNKISSRRMDPSRVGIDDVMSSPVTHIDAGYSIHSAARLMDQCHIHRLAVMEDGALQGIVTQSDIFRAAHQKLVMEEANRFRLLARSANPTFVLNREGHVVYANPAFLDLLAIDDERTLWGRPFLPDTFWVHPEERAAVIRHLCDGDAMVERLVLRTTTGAVRYVSAIATPTLDTQGQVSGTQGVFYDHTARTQAEEATRRANRELQAANENLKQMQGQIVQNEKLASIGQLAAGVAHEMNTPVGFVASNFQTLEKYMKRFLDLFRMYETLGDAVEDGLRERRLQILAQIRQAREAMRIDFVLDDLDQLFSESREGLERVTTIIRNLRDFSRVDQLDTLAEFNLNRAIETTLVVARNEIKYHADVERDLGEIPTLRGNAGEINQVLLNILVNAAQALGAQDREARGHIRVRTRHEEPWVVCTLSDDGPGMPEDVRAHVFDPFFTTKPPGKGTGLGMSVSYDIIVNKHGGQLQVESTVGQGTTFTLRLPCTPTSEVKSSAESDDVVRHAESDTPVGRKRP